MARDRVGKLIGVYNCWSCTHEVPVRQKAEAAGGKLSAPCPWCGFPHYANPGTEHFANLMKAVRLTAPPAATASGASAEGAPTASASSSSNDRSPAPPEKKDPPARRFTGPLGNPFGA